MQPNKSSLTVCNVLLPSHKPDFSDHLISSPQCFITHCGLLAFLQWPNGSVHLPLWRLPAVHERGNEWTSALFMSPKVSSNIDQRVNGGRLIWDQSESEWMFPSKEAIGLCLSIGSEPWPQNRKILCLLSLNLFDWGLCSCSSLT